MTTAQKPTPGTNGQGVAEPKATISLSLRQLLAEWPAGKRYTALDVIGGVMAADPDKRHNWYFSQSNPASRFRPSPALVGRFRTWNPYSLWQDFERLEAAGYLVRHRLPKGPATGSYNTDAWERTSLPMTPPRAYKGRTAAPKNSPWPWTQVAHWEVVRKSPLRAVQEAINTITDTPYRHDEVRFPFCAVTKTEVRHYRAWLERVVGLKTDEHYAGDLAKYTSTGASVDLMLTMLHVRPEFQDGVFVRFAPLTPKEVETRLRTHHHLPEETDAHPVLARWLAYQAEHP